MRVIFFGTLCTFSIAPLRILIEAGCDVAAVIVPTDRIDQRPTDRPSQPDEPIDHSLDRDRQ